jgi:hypothetical protein
MTPVPDHSVATVLDTVAVDAAARSFDAAVAAVQCGVRSFFSFSALQK